MARPFGQSHDDDDDPFHSQLLAVTDDDVADIANAEAVDEDAAGIDMARLMAGTVRELKDLAVVADEDVVLGDAHHDGQVTVGLEHTVFAVDRDEILRLDQFQHEFQFFLAGMARYVDFLIPAGDDVGTEAHEVIDGAADAGFIARDRRCRNDDRIARHDADTAVIVRSHARQAGHRFALAARRQDEDLIVRITVQFIRFDEDPFGDIEIAQFDSNLDVIDHAPSEDSDFAFELHSRIDSLLDTGNIRGECRQNNTAFGSAEGFTEGMTDGRFRFGIASPFRIGAVRHEEQDASAA